VRPEISRNDAANRAAISPHPTGERRRHQAHEENQRAKNRSSNFDVVRFEKLFDEIDQKTFLFGTELVEAGGVERLSVASNVVSSQGLCKEGKIEPCEPRQALCVSSS